MEKVSTPGLDYSFYVVLVRVVNGICTPDHPVSGWTMNLCSIARLKSWGQITVVIMMAVGSGTAVRSTKGCFPNATKRVRRVAFLFCTLFNKFKNFE